MKSSKGYICVAFFLSVVNFLKDPVVCQGGNEEDGGGGLGEVGNVILKS